MRSKAGYQAGMNSTLNFDSPVLVFGGIYSNLHALAALLAEAERRNIAARSMLCTGDIVAYGADARACVELIRARDIRTIAGNCEEQLALGSADCGCGYAPGSVCDTLAARWFTHARDEITSDDRRWMSQLPPRIDVTINGLRLAVVHGSLNQVNRFVFASTPARVMQHDIEEAGADGVIAGHSGIPFSRILGGQLWHNSGALGMPANDGTPRVWFSILTPGREFRTLTIEHAAINYDAHGAAWAMREAGLPEDYASALTSGLWPGCESLPARELKETGVALTPGALEWSGQQAEHKQWPPFESVSPRQKFLDPVTTASGEKRARVTLEKLETLWINTGTLCNLSCSSCYIESTPRNDRLVYITAEEVRVYLDEIERDGLGTQTIGFTGGEPFMNPDMAVMMEDALTRGFEMVVLTNAMKPMRRFERRLTALNARFRDRLIMRVSIDHYTRELHELERGPNSWQPGIDGLKWLAENDFRIHIAGRLYSGEAESIVRAGYGRLAASLGLALDVNDAAELVLFPEMDMSADVPEITESCWDILHKSPAEVMCSNSRMIVKRKGADRPAVIACTLLPYDTQFELGESLHDAARTVPLNHPFCAQFCVLGGAACKR